MDPPQMAAWNLTLRFALELAALAGLGVGAWSSTTGPVPWVAVLVVPLAAATIWGTFNVLDDPSRSGKAPVEVAGWVRLGLQLLILGGGVAGLVIADRPRLAMGLAVLIVLHYLVSLGRIRWLLER